MTSHAIYILKIHNKYRVRLCEQWLFTNGQSNQGGGGGTNCEMERDYTSLLGSEFFKNTTFSCLFSLTIFCISRVENRELTVVLLCTYG